MRTKIFFCMLVALAGLSSQAVVNASGQVTTSPSLADHKAQNIVQSNITSNEWGRPDNDPVSDNGLAVHSKAALTPTLKFFVEVADGQIVRSAPVVADLDNDGQNELLVGTYNGKVYGWDASGNPLDTAIYPFTTGGRITGHLAVGDLDQDGDLEVIAGVSSVDEGVKGRVYIWHHDGSLLTGWPQKTAQFNPNDESQVNTVVLADMDGDLDLEVIAGTDNNILGTSADPDTDVPDLYVWQHDGTLAAGNWPAEDGPAIKFGMIVAGDLDDNGQTDILVGRDYNWLFAYDHQGNNLPGWPVRTFVDPDGANTNTDARIVNKMTSPILADLDHDGHYEYIAPGLRKLPDTSDADRGDLLVLQADGTRRPGWETPAAGIKVLVEDEDLMARAPAVADLDGDNELDIVVPTPDGWIRAYKPDKTLLWEFDYAQGEIIYSSEPVIGDVDNDGLNEVLFGAYDPSSGTVGPTGVWILEKDGSVKAGTPLSVEDPGVVGGPTLADLDGDGLIEIIAAARRGEVYVWDTLSPFNPKRLPWPMPRHDLRRTAFFNAKEFDALKSANVSEAYQGETITYTIRLARVGPPLTPTMQVTDIIPSGISYISGTFTATHGTLDDSLSPMLRWTGALSKESLVQMTYKVSVTTESPLLAINSAEIYTGAGGHMTRTLAIYINPVKTYLPVILKEPEPDSD